MARSCSRGCGGGGSATSSRPFSGVPITANKTTLKTATPHVIVGTPGRILGLLRSKDLKLEKLKHFVLDECDRMLEALGECTLREKLASQRKT